MANPHLWSLISSGGGGGWIFCWSLSSHSAPAGTVSMPESQSIFLPSKTEQESRVVSSLVEQQTRSSYVTTNRGWASLEKRVFSLHKQPVPLYNDENSQTPAIPGAASGHCTLAWPCLFLMSGVTKPFQSLWSRDITGKRGKWGLVCVIPWDNIELKHNHIPVYLRPIEFP